MLSLSLGDTRVGGCGSGGVGEEALYLANDRLSAMSALDGHTLGTVADRRAPVEHIGLAALVVVPIDIRPPHVRAPEDARSGRAAFPTSDGVPRGRLDPLHPAPHVTVDDRLVRVLVDEFPEVELAEHDPRLEQRLHAVERPLRPPGREVCAHFGDCGAACSRIERLSRPPGRACPARGVPSASFR